MNKLQKISTVVVVGTAFLGGGVAGHRLTKMEDSELTKVLREYDTDGDYKIGFGEAVYIVDKDRNGHLSDSERRSSDEIRQRFETMGRAMLESAENIARVQQTIEAER